MSKPMTEARPVPQKISASYIADLIELNTQTLNSLAEREKSCDNKYTSDEWVCVFEAHAMLDKYIDKLSGYHAFLVAKEDAEHRAERKSKSGLSGRMYE